MQHTYKLTFIINGDQVFLADTLLEERLNATAISTTRFNEQLDQWKCESYYPEKPCENLVNEVLQQLNIGNDQIDGVPKVEELPDQDWVAKVQSDLSPVKAEQIIIHGQHDRKRFIQSPFAIEIDAGQAFGTAHHGTTQGCLRALQGLFKSRDYNNILDLGTGTGILAIAARKLNKHTNIIASDIDKISTQVALENCKINRVGNSIKIIHATGLKHKSLKEKTPYDLIIANILAQPLMKLAPEFSQSLINNGHIILSGLLQSQSRQVIAHYLNHGFIIERRIPIDEWMTLIMRKYDTRPLICVEE